MDAGVIPKPDTGHLPFAKLSGHEGRAYATWLMNPRILLPRLVSDLKGQQVTFQAREFSSKDEIINNLKEPIIVNCTGLGAGKLFNDKAVVGKRGHLVVLQKTLPEQNYFLSGGCCTDEVSYIFCRQNDIVVGGSIVLQRSATDDERFYDPDEAMCKNVLNKGRAFIGGQLTVCDNLMHRAHTIWPVAQPADDGTCPSD